MVDLNEKAYIGSYCVSTVALTVKHPGGMWFETYIFPANGESITDWCEVWGERYPSLAEAVAGHERVCEDLRAGRLTTWGGETLDPASRADGSLSAPPGGSSDG